MKSNVRSHVIGDFHAATSRPERAAPLGPADLGACLALDRIALKGSGRQNNGRELTEIEGWKEDEQSDLIASAGCCG